MGRQERAMSQVFGILASIVGAIALLLIALEIGLRSFLGFGKPLLYKADAQIGYLLVPNQRTRRFGNHIAINQFSMRCDEFSPQRSPDTFRILLLGDSIVNGGWWTDQQNTISALLQKNITHSEVLNASANSWGPRNELAYLQRLGSFESQLVVLVINTDDLFATAPTSLPVGRDRNSLLRPLAKPLAATPSKPNRFLKWLLCKRKEAIAWALISKRFGRSRPLSKTIMAR
jgi:hypothetical protein